MEASAVAKDSKTTSHSQMVRWLRQHDFDPMAEAIRKELQRLKEVERGQRRTAR